MDPRARRGTYRVSRGCANYEKSRYLNQIISPMIVFGVVIGLFILAILSVWIFPNKSVSQNEHDIKH